MSEVRTDALSERYAESLQELVAAQGGDFAAVCESLDGVLELAANESSFAEFLRSPIIDPKKRDASLVRMLMGQVEPVTLNFLRLLNNKGRLVALPGIVEAAKARADAAAGRVRVSVTTAADMSNEHDALTEKIGAAVGGAPVITWKVDPSLIGGLRLQVGDRLIDGSIASRLRRLEYALQVEAGAKIRARASEMVGS
jgi:F-type H+-transporting ATPase subunit delta